MSATIGDLQAELKTSVPKRARFRDGVRLLRGAEDPLIDSRSDLLESPLGTAYADAGVAEQRHLGRSARRGVDDALHWHEFGKWQRYHARSEADNARVGARLAVRDAPQSASGDDLFDGLEPLGDTRPFGNGVAPLGDHSQWPYASYESVESWPTVLPAPGSSSKERMSFGEKKLDAAVPDRYYDEDSGLPSAVPGGWGLGSRAKVLNSGHTGGAPHDNDGDQQRAEEAGEKYSTYVDSLPVSGAGGDASYMRAPLATSLLHAQKAVPSAKKQEDWVGKDKDWKSWVDLALEAT